MDKEWRKMMSANFGQPPKKEEKCRQPFMIRRHLEPKQEEKPMTKEEQVRRGLAPRRPTLPDEHYYPPLDLREE